MSKKKPCEFCKGEFSNLKRHHVSCPVLYPDKVQFICSNCKRSFDTLQGLRAHEKSGTCFRECDVCGKTYFRSKKQWENHCATHGEGVSKIYSCRHCETGFTKYESVLDHLANSCTIWKFKFKCPLVTCKKKYETLNWLSAIVHIVNCRPRADGYITCFICDQKLGAEEFIWHVEKEIMNWFSGHHKCLHYCNECGIPIASANVLKRHNQNHVVEKKAEEKLMESSDEEVNAHSMRKFSSLQSNPIRLTKIKYQCPVVICRCVLEGILEMEEHVRQKHGRTIPPTSVELIGVRVENFRSMAKDPRNPSNVCYVCKKAFVDPLVLKHHQYWCEKKYDYQVEILVTTSESDTSDDDF